MAQIKIDYQDTINKAKQLEDISLEIKNICTREMNEANSYCKSMWKGDASDIYQKKMEQIQKRITTRGTNLQKTAQALKEAALRYKRIEEAAASIFGR